MLESGEKHIYGSLADLDLASINDEALDKLPAETAKLLKKKGPDRRVKRKLCLEKLTTAFQGMITFMAIELLWSQVRHLKDEQVARKKGKLAYPTLETPQEVNHDLKALILVLVYAR